MNQIHIITFVFALLTFATCRSAHAVFIILENGENVVGFLVEATETRVTIREATAGGRGRPRHIPRGEIKRLLPSADPERLESLGPDDPKQYRNYAEEVAAKAKKDPEAREIAIRLYLIAAHLDTQNLGKSSLLGMINLARSPAEEKNFRALAYLLDPAHDQRVLKRPKSDAVDSSELDPKANEKLSHAIKSLRRGNLVAARNLSRDPAVRMALKPFADTLSYPEFEKAAQSGEVPPDLLSKLVSVELQLMKDPSGSASPELAKTGGDSPNWAAIIAERDLKPVPSLALETITEFDPAKCHYRNGKWVEP